MSQDLLVAVYRLRAKQCRHRAKIAARPQEEAQWLHLGETWEDLADKMERFAAGAWLNEPSSALAGAPFSVAHSFVALRRPARPFLGRRGLARLGRSLAGIALPAFTIAWALAVWLWTADQPRQAGTTAAKLEQARSTLSAPSVSAGSLAPPNIAALFPGAEAVPAKAREFVADASGPRLKPQRARVQQQGKVRAALKARTKASVHVFKGGGKVRFVTRIRPKREAIQWRYATSSASRWRPSG